MVRVIVTQTMASLKNSDTPAKAVHMVTTLALGRRSSTIVCAMSQALNGVERIGGVEQLAGRLEAGRTMAMRRPFFS
jgi:hypothetical protein